MVPTPRRYHDPPVAVWAVDTGSSRRPVGRCLVACFTFTTPLASALVRCVHKPGIVADATLPICSTCCWSLYARTARHIFALPTPPPNQTTPTFRNTPSAPAPGPSASSSTGSSPPHPSWRSTGTPCSQTCRRSTTTVRWRLAVGRVVLLGEPAARASVVRERQTGLTVCLNVT